MLASPAAYRLPPRRQSGQPVANLVGQPRGGRMSRPTPSTEMNKRGHQIVSARSVELAGVPGLEPRLTGPEPVGLPITPYPNGIAPWSAPTQSSGLPTRRPIRRRSQRLDHGQAGLAVQAEPASDPGRAQERQIVAGHQDRTAVTLH